MNRQQLKQKASELRNRFKQRINIQKNGAIVGYTSSLFCILFGLRQWYVEKIDLRFKEQDQKIDSVFKEQNAKIEKNFKEQDMKIEQKFKEYDNKIEQRFREQDNKMEQRFRDQDHKIEMLFERQQRQFDSQFALINARLDGILNMQIENTKMLVRHDEQIKQLQQRDKVIITPLVVGSVYDGMCKLRHQEISQLKEQDMHSIKSTTF